MKTPAFIVTGVMACLMLLSQPINAQTDVATFNLKASLTRATCAPLMLSGSEDTDVYFGIVSMAESHVEKTKQVVLTLHCDSASPPSVVNLGFKVQDGTIGSSGAGVLIPQGVENEGAFIPQGVSYQLKWGEGITETVALASTEYSGLKPGQGVELISLQDNQATTDNQYLLVQRPGKTDWNFPVDITFNLEKTSDGPQVHQGYYHAALSLAIRYD